VPSPDLTVLYGKSMARWKRVKALNAGRARHALRIDKATLASWAATEGLITKKDTAGILWLVPTGTP
jgi:hypothetical protein